MYNRYKLKGFEVFGVSIDRKKRDWLKAVVQDRIKYTQVIELSGWESAVSGKYGIDQIPFSFLLDKTGKIVAIDLEGAELEHAIKMLL